MIAIAHCTSTKCNCQFISFSASATQRTLSLQRGLREQWGWGSVLCCWRCVAFSPGHWAKVIKVNGLPRTGTPSLHKRYMLITDVFSHSLDLFQWQYPPLYINKTSCKLSYNIKRGPSQISRNLSPEDLSKAHISSNMPMVLSSPTGSMLGHWASMSLPAGRIKRGKGEQTTSLKLVI